MALQSVNPSTGETIEEYPRMRRSEAEDIIEQVHQAYTEWRTTSYDERSRLLRRVAEELENNAGKYADLMAKEMGKPLSDGISEAKKCAWVCNYYADHGAEFLAPEMVETDASKSYVTFEPIGVVLAIMPWNFPLWQVFRFAAPTLMAGNGAVLKHAENVTGCALAVENIFQSCGFPKNLFRAVLVDRDTASGLIEHDSIRAVTLTGSVRAGKAVAAKAGAVLKKTVLELGGSDAYVVLEDADVDSAVEKCVASRLINAGQSCIAAKRFIVVDKHRDEFERGVIQRMGSVRMGDPFEDETEIGPMARLDLRDELHRQVEESVAAGARCLLGGKLPDGPGAFYPPTVLSSVEKGMPAYEDELFGPVASIITVRGDDEALSVANDSRFGLGAAVFTRDAGRGERIAAREIDAGCCFVNDFVRSDPRLPFGGVKESGYGRELSAFGIREFVNIKTVYVE